MDLASVVPDHWAIIAVAPFIGSFLGLLIRRLPQERPIAWSRSRCDHCGATLGLGDLVPLLSWIAARGRCRHCHESLGWFYPAVEIAAVIVAIIAVIADTGARAWLDCLFGWWLLVLAWIDAERWVLLDKLTLPLIAMGLVAALGMPAPDLLNRGLGAVCGYAAMRAISWAYTRVRGEVGLGRGDAKMLAASGAWVGATGLAGVLLGAALAGLAAAGAMLAVGIRLRRDTALPFGPFLAVATWAMWLFGSSYL